MRIESHDGQFVEVKVVGYQFPAAEDPRQRFSWHMVEGRANDNREEWSFSGPWLTCDESFMIGPWLERAASFASVYDPLNTEQRADPPVALSFTEPNIAFDLAPRQVGVRLRVSFDLEFLPPGQATRLAGYPVTVDLDVDCDRLSDAARTWNDEVAAFPDGPVS